MSIFYSNGCESFWIDTIIIFVDIVDLGDNALFDLCHKALEFPFGILIKHGE
jgi:hypothetical protein